MPNRFADTTTLEERMPRATTEELQARCAKRVGPAVHLCWDAVVPAFTFRPRRDRRDGWHADDGKVAVITGGASGIGRGLAEELARRGAEVVVADRQAELAREVATARDRDSGLVEAVAGAGAPRTVADAQVDRAWFRRGTGPR